jgi:type IX secretion system PorP/SprF family membrane protein
VLFAGHLLAQDASFSQFYSHGTYLNPALTGAEGMSKITLGHRSQWGTSTAAYTTCLTTLEISRPEKTGSFGVQLMNDEQGDGILNNQGASFIYAHQLQLNRSSYLTMALQAGFGQLSLHTEGLIFEDQFRNGKVENSSREVFGKQQQTYPDFATGFAYLSPKLNLGLALHHLVNQDHQENNLQLPKRKISLHASYKLAHQGMRNRHAYFAPSVIFRNQGDFTSLYTGFNFKHRHFTLSGWYSSHDFLITALGLDLERFRLGYSVDLYTGKMITPGLTHEFSLAILLNDRKSERQSYTTRLFCPSF